MCVLICGSDQICLKSFGNFEHEKPQFRFFRLLILSSKSRDKNLNHLIRLNSTLIKKQLFFIYNLKDSTFPNFSLVLLVALENDSDKSLMLTSKSNFDSVQLVSMYDFCSSFLTSICELVHFFSFFVFLFFCKRSSTLK